VVLANIDCTLDKSKNTCYDILNTKSYPTITLHTSDENGELKMEAYKDKRTAKAI